MLAETKETCMPYSVRRRNNEARREAAKRLATVLPEEVAQNIAQRLPGWLAKEVVARWRAHPSRGDGWDQCQQEERQLR